MSKVNMFQADKAFSARVNEYMHCKVWSIVIKTRLRKQVEGLETSITNAESLRGSILDVDDHIDKLIAGYKAQIVDAEKQAKAQADKEAKFDYTDTDRAFYKAYVAAKDVADVLKALQDFCMAYHLSIRDTSFEQELLDIIAGGRKLGATQVIRSKATRFTSDKRAKGDVLNLLYGRIAEKMLQAGTLKAQDIPADIAKAYAKKSSK